MKTKNKQIFLVLLALLLIFGCKDVPPVEYTDHISDLPSMSEHFKGTFLIGNIMNPGDVSGSSISNSNLTRHFNILTCENHMKPSYLAKNKGSYDFTEADKMVDAAIESGMKVVGHTLLWHNQNASWMNNTVTKQDMIDYITAVVGHFEDKIYSWDVLNEAFPDGVSASADWKKSMRSGNYGNPWFVAIGSDFVYEGFLAARKANSNAILYYNDYNTDDPGKAQMIFNMVRDVNNKYFTSGNKPSDEKAGRLLIEGIGMQEHHNLGISAQRIEKTIKLFRSLNVPGRDSIKLSVSELDIMAFPGYNEFRDAGGEAWPGTEKDQDPRSPGNSALHSQANLYRDYMKLYIENKDIIERVSLWGVTDDKSWRSLGRPLLFNRDGYAKPAYYSFVGALSK